MSYEVLPAFEHYYLEDSWVVGIYLQPRAICFDMELVVLETDPFYSPPRPGEQYCYRTAKILFSGITKVECYTWYSSLVQEGDLGNIDSLTVRDGMYEVKGDWGHLVFASDEPTVELPCENNGNII